MLGGLARYRLPVSLYIGFNDCLTSMLLPTALDKDVGQCVLKLEMQLQELGGNF